MSESNLKKICFIGAGTMGCYNSLIASLAGYECAIFDNSEKILENRVNNQIIIAQYLNQSNFFNGKDTNAAIQSINNCKSLDSALFKADLVSESISENLSMKIKLFNKIESTTDQNVILTTNTSSLSVDKINRGLNPNTKFAALHSYLGSKLMDIVKGPYTSDETIDRIVNYVNSISQYPLVLNKEHLGYVLNFMLGGLLTQSLLMVIEKKYTIQEIDASWKSLNNSEVGPFGMMDIFGLDIVKQAWQEKESDSFHIVHKEKIIDLLSKYVEENCLGLKTGKGFYDYSNIYLEHDNNNYNEIQKDLYIGIIETAIVLSSRKILEEEKINKAWIVGTNLTCGPFDHLRGIGFVKFKEDYEEWIARDHISSEFCSIVKNYLLRK